MVLPLKYETVWFDKFKFDDAEKHWLESIKKSKGETAESPSIWLPLKSETVWFEKFKFDDAEKHWEEYIRKQKPMEEHLSKRSLVDEIAHARQQIKKSLQSGDSLKTIPSFPSASDLYTHFQKLEAESGKLKTLVQDLLRMVTKLDARVSALEGQQPIITHAMPTVFPLEETKIQQII